MILPCNPIAVPTPPGGSSGQVQYNNGGVFGGSSGLTWDGSILSVPAGIITSKVYPAADSTTAFQINKADGTTNVLNVDTTNGRVGILTSSPSEALHLGSGGVLRCDHPTYGSSYYGTISNAAGQLWLQAFGGGAYVQIENIVRVANNNSGVTIGAVTTPIEMIDLHGNFCIRSPSPPTSDVAGAFKAYAYASPNGEYCPTFRCDNGTVIQLYKQAAITPADGTLAGNQTAINAVITALQNMNLLG